ncbi:MAG: pilus assembly protein PilM [Lachnospiraceae bacterium]|nr:pilus assembly protein PilM [Lachnospiraceae bacterium]
MLGIDIGTDSVKMAYVKGRRVACFVEAPLPENAVKNGRIISFNALADVIRTMRKENRIRCKRASVSVAATNNIVVRRITMPKMTEEQLMVNMPYELHDFLNSDIKDYLFDYSLISMNEKDMTIMACAIGKSTVTNFRIMAKIAGIKIEKIVPDVIALQAILPVQAETVPTQTTENSNAVKTESAESGDSSEEEIIAMTPREERRAKKKAEAEARKKAKQEAAAKAEARKAAEQAAAAEVPAAASSVSGMDPYSISAKMPWEMSAEERKESSESTGRKNDKNSESAEISAAGHPISDDGEMEHGKAKTQSNANGADVSGGSRQASPQPGARDFVILDIGHSGTRMYFYSNYTFEITRNIDAGSDRIVDIIARNNGMDKHAALTRLMTNQPSVMADPEVDDEVSNLVAQVMRSINFYGYNNLNNTIDRIYYMGSGIPTECYLKRLEEATEMNCEPVSDLLPEEARAAGINDGPQVYGCIVE